MPLSGIVKFLGQTVMGHNQEEGICVKEFIEQVTEGVS